MYLGPTTRKRSIGGLASEGMSMLNHQNRDEGRHHGLPLFAMSDRCSSRLPGGRMGTMQGCVKSSQMGRPSRTIIPRLSRLSERDVAREVLPPVQYTGHVNETFSRLLHRLFSVDTYLKRCCRSASLNRCCPVAATDVNSDMIVPSCDSLLTRGT